MSASLRLFNAVQVADKQPQNHDEALLARTVAHGYLLDPAIPADPALLDTIEEIVGISGEKANAAFHKSWQVVRDTPLETLVIQQIVHYITTYGFEELGIYHQSTVYIPHETLEVPAIRKDMPLVVIKAMTAEEILAAIVQLGSSGMALSQTTLADIITLVKANHYAPDFVPSIRNRELKALLDEFYAVVPTEPVEFLRYVINKLTGSTLLIKSAELIKKIKKSDGKLLDELVTQAPSDFASIFLRYKPLFLALKAISSNKTFFNRLRKQAVTQHQPLPVDYLNNITNQIQHNELDLTKLEQRLAKATIFRKIRLAYALYFRNRPNNQSIVYQVRNGRGWATDFAWDQTNQSRTALELVLRSIVADLRENVGGKTIYIPANVHYALPATEKQFTGFFPTGSYISVPNDLLIGIHWFNNKHRIDLDLSMLNATGKIGWDAYYYDENQDILFSGDVVDAPKPLGATELFYFKNIDQEPRIIFVNHYNFRPDNPVDCRLLVANEKPTNLTKNYMIDPNNMVASPSVNLTRAQTVIGIVMNVEGENRVYFTNVSIGNSITASYKPHTAHALNYFLQRFTDTLDLRHLLTEAGANIVTELPENGAEFINLAPTALDATSFLSLLMN